MSLENTPDDFNYNPSVIHSATYNPSLTQSATNNPSLINSSPRSKKKLPFFMSENNNYYANNSNENSLVLPNKFRLAKKKKKRLKDKYNRSKKRMKLIKSKLQNKNFFQYYNNLSSKYNNASNINNNDISAFYNEYKITPSRNLNNVQQNNRVPTLVKERGLKQALKIKKVNIREGELILNELKQINENYSKFFQQYKSKYRIRNKLDNLYQYGKNLPQKILEYFKIIRKKLYKMVHSIYGFIIDGFNYAFDLLKHVLLSIGGLILTFFKTSYGAIVWVYNKSGEIKSVFLNCISSEPTRMEYNEDEINKKCDEYLDSITDTFKVVNKSLSKKKDQMMIMEDLELSACIIQNTNVSDIDTLSNNGYEANNNSNQIGSGVIAPTQNKPLIQYLFESGIWAIGKLGKFVLSTLCFSVKWSLRTSLFVFKNTAVNLIKEGIFLIVPKNNKFMRYIINYCQNTFDFLMQNEEYVYRLTKKVIDERNNRLINGPRVKFYHKTTNTAAGSIINYQTFFRSERGGFFGKGIYFCSNPNSTHNKANPTEKTQTLLVAEVLVGEILNINTADITFGDLLSLKCDTIRGTKLKDNEYVVFSQDQICNIKDYTNPIGFWGYKWGKQSALVVGHETKYLNEITHHNYWFPNQGYGSTASYIINPIVVNFDGPNAQIVPHKPWTGTDKDLYEIYKKYIKSDFSLYKKYIQGVEFFTDKKSKRANKFIVTKGLGNPHMPLTYNLFINLINTKFNYICDKNKQIPIHLDDRLPP